ncbi:MAG: hypothetical protein KDE24_05905, partial [Caldilinea sp.]|nr:hypothetical protein [Caldilinea sp.]
MSTSTMKRLMIFIGIAFLLTIPIGVSAVNARNAGDADLAAVWQRVQESGAYAFSADITQRNTPQATVLNAGRKATRHAYYLEGETDIRAESLHLMLWTGGGSVHVPNSGTEMLIEGDQARARQGNGAWEEIDDFTGLFAPGGDFLAYTQAAQNVVRHAPEVRSTPLGEISITRYTFDIDGRKLAIHMRAEMSEEAMREGLPANASIELPTAYAEMTGTGELWVGADGLPLRQIFALEFPPDADAYVSTAEVTVDFSDFAPLPTAGGPGTLGSQFVSSLQAVGNLQNALSLLAAAMALWLMALVVLGRRSKRVYVAVVSAVVCSMLVTPLLSSRQVSAYSTRQEEKRAAQEELQGRQEVQETVQVQMRTAAMNPHADPLAAAQAAAVAAPMLQSASDGRYFDPSCETDPAGDIDADGLTNLSECLLGTLPDVADTDNDGVADAVEVTGFSYRNQTWYTDPANADSNNDGISDGKEWYLNGDIAPPDTNGDGTPDLWDDDNDNDGVRDTLDLSPYASTSRVNPFDGANPFELTINDLVESELVRVEFQIRPTESSHLWYSQSVLDWPQGDQQDQIQDVDGKTFADLDPTLPAWPNANGDMRLTPMLEIAMDMATANLPSEPCTDADGNPDTCYPLLEQFGISVQQTDDNTLTAYVPLQVVSDNVGDDNVAFYARMFYESKANWGAAHQVRVSWVLQMLNDVCGYPDTPPAGYPANTVWPPDPDQPPGDWNADENGAWPAQYSLFQDGLCQFYSSMNELQVLNTYDEAWYITGMHVMEEHSADIALIYEDPSVTGSVGAGYDSPLYVDTLYGLLYGLNSTFLAARDCDSTDAGGNCQGNGQLDITVDTIGDRFNHATNGYSADNPIYWGLPNVLSVVKNGVERAPGDGRSSYTDIPTYEAIDLGMLDTTTVQTMHVLTSTFDAAWSASDPITPTIMMASQQSYRDLNLDRFISNDPNISWNSNRLTLNLPQSGDNTVEVDTLATVKWTPYAYDPATGWAAADIDDYYNELSTLLVDAFSGISDPDEAETQLTMAQLLYISAYGGDANVVQIGVTIPDYGYQQPDEPLYISLTATTLTYIAKAANQLYTFTTDLKEIASTFRYAVGTQEVISKYLDVKIFSQLPGWKGIAAGVAGILLLTLFATDAVVNYILGDSNTKLGIGLNDAVQIVFILYAAYDITMKVVKVVQLALAASKADTAAAFVDALSETLSESSTVLDASKFLGVVGLVIAIGVAVGMFIYAWAKGDISPGNVAFNEALAATIAAVIVAVLFFVLALTVVGLIIVLIIALIDAILQLVGSKFTITGWITKSIAWIIYQLDLETTQDVESGQLDIVLMDPDLGITTANSLLTSLPVTTTLYEKFPPGWSYKTSPDYVAQNSMIYELSTASKSLSTSKGARSDWTTSVYDSFAFNNDTVDLYQATVTDHLSTEAPLVAGVNASTPLWLNSAYALMADSCWVGFCKRKPIPGNSSDSLGTIAVLDVLPATLDEFVAVSDWGTLTFLDADGDGMLSHRDGGLDPDDSTPDIDQDRLSDAYEVTIRSLPSDQGGVALRSDSGDSDSDSIPDYVEMRWGTDPGNRDSDGDGLLDEQELAPRGGWLIAYAYDEISGITSETRVWSDPNRADGDGDGMSDLFEQDQDILQVDPFADPADPRVYNPNVWNESPVALYIDDNTTDGFIKPGATVVYTTTTANNLSSGQELVGQLSLSLPTGVTGAPISQTVDIASGASSSLVSTLQFPGSVTAQYTISSLMSLTDFDQTRWSWDESDGSRRNGLNGTPQAVAITPVDGWEASYLVATLERATNGNEAISTYVVRGDGTVEQANTQLLPQSANVLNSPDVACNSAGVCILLWGANNSGQTSGFIAGVRLDRSPQSQTTIVPFANGEVIRNLSVATDGANFMVAWAASRSNNTQTVIRVTSIGADGSVGSTQAVATLNGAAGGAAIDWTGSSYTVIWTGDGNVSRASVSTSGVVSNAGVIAAGAAWPQSNGGVHPPSIAYDAVSGQALVTYRSPAGQLAARRLGSGISAEIIIAADGVSGDNVSVAISPDTENSGWVVAWVPSAGGATAFSAISPLGAVRTDVSSVDKLTLTAVALACIQPEYELILEFNDAEGAQTFADSSGNMNNAFCQTAASCPLAGVTGKFGSAVSFDGSDDLLRVNGNIAIDVQKKN